MEMQEGSREEKADWDTIAAHIAQVTGAFSTAHVKTRAMHAHALTHTGSTCVHPKKT